MDLLGSILNSMDAPPVTENKEARDKKHKMLKLQKDERKKVAEFRAKVEKEINELIEDPKRKRHKYPPMNKIQRSIIHDVAEVAGLTTFSFGEDEVDRYVMLFKKEFPPSDEELDAYRNRLEYDPEAPSKTKNADTTLETTASGSSEETIKEDSAGAKYWPGMNPLKQDSTPATFYKDKYKHLLGSESGKAAAKATKSNISYGVVPSENKRDLRSIEETLNDIKRKKQKKT
ncbi:sperm-associated antigen 7 homolog [Actinia tenebrosa]|uniref:Sperm-associated antigen 7 homolog n=1 Tax=Actinia tenebrosa TaxID=6105 RepID=A0A6P8IPY9_ACTTE|nr:sperm-associated antigen 7 homolog [Actinia tenebrosa]XP_031569131.1 sperm-associated antigen 7 homolog [Actinia tenebrosa]